MSVGSSNDQMVLLPRYFEDDIYCRNNKKFEFLKIYRKSQGSGHSLFQGKGGGVAKNTVRFWIW